MAWRSPTVLALVRRLPLTRRTMEAASTLQLGS